MMMIDIEKTHTERKTFLLEAWTTAAACLIAQSAITTLVLHRTGHLQ